MGRPLYSIVLNSRASSTASSTAASRASSPAEPAVPVLEKWSPWNAFDPDADAFFESEDAVYEAFLDTPEYFERTNESQPPLLSLVEALAISPSESSVTPETSAESTDGSAPSSAAVDDAAPWAMPESWQRADAAVPFIPPMPMPSMAGHDGEFSAQPSETRQPSGLPSPDFSENRYTTLYSNYSREDVTPSSYTTRARTASIIPTSHPILFNELFYVPGRISGDTLVA